MAENKKTPELKEILWHPLVLVVLGAGVVWDAPGNIVVRSIFLVALWILVSLDIGWLLWRMRWRLHSWAIIVCAASQLSGMGTMEIMKWLLSEKLEEQQKDVAAKLDATMFFPASLNIFQSATNIKNRGNTAVGKHYLRCYIVSLVDGRRFWDDYLQPIEPEKTELAAYIGEETDYCLSLIGPLGMPICADVTVNFFYSLTTQPDIEKQASWRFALRNEGKDNFVWRGQKVDQPGTYCTSPDTSPPETDPFRPHPSP